MKVIGPKTNLKGKGSVCLTRDQEIDYLLKNSMVTERGCWEWIGGVNESGYGLCFRTVDGQKIYLMHRWA